MAQYVFWTGDEEGVAKAVEEFIRKGLVSVLFSSRFHLFSTKIVKIELLWSQCRCHEKVQSNF